MSNEPSSSRLLVELANPYIAEYLAGFLKDSGIPAFVKGENLQDPVAFSRRAVGDLSTRVYVHEKDLAEANRLLEQARAEGKLDPDRATDEDA